jgi:hypothetical protein
MGFAKDPVSLGGALLATPDTGGQELAYAYPRLKESPSLLGSI